MLNDYKNAMYPFVYCTTTEDERFIRFHRTKIDKEIQFFRWDVAEGFRVMTKLDEDKNNNAWVWERIAIRGYEEAISVNDPNVQVIIPAEPEDERIVNAQLAMRAVQYLPAESIIFVYDMHKFFPDEVDGIFVIRQILDIEKTLIGNSQMMVFLSASVKIPIELQKSFTVIDFSLPKKEDLKVILNKSVKDNEDNKIAYPVDDKVIVNALQGLDEKGAENALSLSLVRHGNYDVECLLDEKASVLKTTEYVSYVKHAETLDGLFGLQKMKDFTLKIINSPKRQAKGILIDGVQGSGKCVGIGTLVVMCSGEVCPVEDIKIGDLLMGPDSKPRKVSGITTGYGDLYRVTPTKGNPYVVNKEHVISLKKIDTDDILNISIKDYLKKIKDTPAACTELLGWRTGVDFPKNEVSIPPYLLGVWLCGGDSSNPAFSLNIDDVEIVEYLKTYVKKIGMFISTKKIKNKHCLRLRIVSKIEERENHTNKFLNQLIEIDVINNKHIPHGYLANDRKSRLEILAGLIDTDGHIYGNGTCCEITTVFDTLSDNILYLSRSLGLAAYESEKIVKMNGKTLSYHRINISGDLSVIPTKTKRRKFSKRKQIKNVLKTGITVKQIEPGDYYGFELDGDRLFLLGDFTVTHNSHFAKAIAGATGRPCLIVNFGALRGSLQGQTEERTANMLKIVQAFGNPIVFCDEFDKSIAGLKGGASTDGGSGTRIMQAWMTYMVDKTSDDFWICTSNDMDTIKEFSGGALIRRFNAAFFIDMPSADECKGISKIWTNRYGVNIPEDYDFDGFTGADIEKLAGTMEMLECDADEARQYVIPTAKALGPQLNEIRKQAAGLTINASEHQSALSVKRKVKIKQSKDKSKWGK